MSEPRPAVRRRILSADELTGARSLPLPQLGAGTARAWLTRDEIVRRVQEAGRRGEAAGYARGLQEGLQQGRAEGAAATESRLREERRREIEALGADYAERLQALYTSARDEMTRVESQAAEAFAGFCLSVAQKVVQHTLAVDPEVIVSVVRSGLERVAASTGEIVCRLNPADLEAVREALGSWDSPTESLRLRPDDGIARGGCTLETPDLSLDLTLATRWQQAMADLGRDGDGRADAQGDADD